ncbi:protein rolling stone-like [Pollicipes pollicipes]|uniref:protein rolling stone-like n=1 Tax=Pollicipes pollicipes TaxID=41117 RepID=UPI0018850D28|nr:protein rolling stone-like [Pollicipes pollicipes]
MGCQLQLKWRKFGLTHHHPVRFGTAQWQDKESISLPFLLYRFVVFGYFFGFFIWNLLHDFTSATLCYYLIYLTNWTYLTALLDTIVQLVSAILAAYRCHKGIKPALPSWLYQLHWAIINISHTMEPFVSVLYWTAVYPQINVAVTYSDIHLHLLTTLYTLGDLMVHGSPRRYHHVTFPLCYGLAYLLFTIIYYACGGLDPKGNTGIYPILDWAQPGLTLGVAAGAVVAIFVLHAVTWGMVQGRMHLHGTCLGKKVSVDAEFERGDGGGDGGREESGCESPEGQEELCVDVDIGDGAGGNAARAGRPTAGARADSKKAFDNAALTVGDETATSQPQPRAPVA